MSLHGLWPALSSVVSLTGNVRIPGNAAHRGPETVRSRCAAYNRPPMLSLIDRLKDLAAASPTRPRWVIVPTHAVGRMAADRLALDMGGWTNMRIVTPLDLALRMGAPFLVERGIDPSE